MSNYTEENLIWSALDAPLIQPNNWDLFWDAWNKHAGSSYLIKSDPAGNILSPTTQDTDFFKGLNIYSIDDRLINGGNHWQVPYLDYKEIFPNVLDDLHAAFPWAQFIFCRLWMSNIPIPWHRDHAPEAGALRAMIYNENKKPTFKVFNPSQIFNPSHGKYYVDLPETTNTFIYNNKVCMHGSDREEGINKIILLTLHLIKDRQLFEEHLKKSAEKYPANHKYT